MELKETPLFSNDNCSVSSLRLVMDDSFLNKNILILERKSSEVTDTRRLPDGIKDSEADHLILKINYDSQPDDGDFLGGLAYCTLYKQNLALTDREVQLFVVSVQTPSQKTRERFGYQYMRCQGVYDSQEPIFAGVPLISLNELSAQPHNAILKFFASQKDERQKAGEILQQNYPELISASFKSLLLGLSKVDGEYTDYTPEQVLEMGEEKGENFVRNQVSSRNGMN